MTVDFSGLLGQWPLGVFAASLLYAAGPLAARALKALRGGGTKATKPATRRRRRRTKAKATT